MSFSEAVNQCHMGRISLSSTGFYSTPEIHWDDNSLTGSPYYYFAYGVALSEVIVDTLTGEAAFYALTFCMMQAISINPALDKGQVEGGFVQGVGWLTTKS